MANYHVLITNRRVILFTYHNEHKRVNFYLLIDIDDIFSDTCIQTGKYIQETFCLGNMPVTTNMQYSKAACQGQTVKSAPLKYWNKDWPVNLYTQDMRALTCNTSVIFYLEFFYHSFSYFQNRVVFLQLYFYSISHGFCSHVETSVALKLNVRLSRVLSLPWWYMLYL